MACLLQPECNFLHGFFRCKLPVEVVDVEVKNHVHARDPYIQKRSDIAGNQVHTMEHKTLPPPHNHQKDEDLYGGGR